jgi:hypothetical protein
MREISTKVEQTGEDCVAPPVLAKNRLDRLVQRVAALDRKAHLTAEEARYVHQRARVQARDT